MPNRRQFLAAAGVMFTGCALHAQNTTARKRVTRLNGKPIRAIDIHALECDDEMIETPGEHADGRIDLDEALKVLGAPERLCVTLCFGAGLSHAEAADALNLPLGTVKSHVKRGLEKLRTRLAPANGAAVEGRQGNG